MNVMWRDDAACRDADPELFFPGKGESIEAAVEFCRACPVIVECHDYAVRHKAMGVWGGVRPPERKEAAR